MRVGLLGSCGCEVLLEPLPICSIASFGFHPQEAEAASPLGSACGEAPDYSLGRTRIVDRLGNMVVIRERH